MDPLERAIHEALIGERLPCERAFALASRLGVAPIRIGEAANRLVLRISRCQLGLFGFEDDEPGRMSPAPHVLDPLREAIQARRVEGKVPCAAAWETAAAFGLPKLEVADAIEGLGLRVSRCQLGCFR